jgi:hypothetical protein
MKDAKYVNVTREQGKIKFSPTINGSTSGANRGYHHQPDHNLELEDLNAPTIGETLKLAWDKCK